VAFFIAQIKTGLCGQETTIRGCWHAQILLYINKIYIQSNTTFDSHKHWIYFLISQIRIHDLIIIMFFHVYVLYIQIASLMGLFLHYHTQLTELSCLVLSNCIIDKSL